MHSGRPRAESHRGARQRSETERASPSSVCSVLAFLLWSWHPKLDPTGGLGAARSGAKKQALHSPGPGFQLFASPFPVQWSPESETAMLPWPCAAVRCQITAGESLQGPTKARAKPPARSTTRDRRIPGQHRSPAASLCTALLLLRRRRRLLPAAVDRLMPAR